MLNILITGANGFIGSHLVDKFIAEGFKVFGFVRTTSDLSLLKGKQVTLRYGDITDYHSVKEALSGIDIVVHNAGLASDWGSLELFRKINLSGTKNVTKAAKYNSVKRMVHMSTTAIHGFNQPHAVSEDESKKPVFNYGLSKLEAENWLLDFHRTTNVDIVIIRPGNVFGPWDHTFIDKYIKAMLCGKIAYINKGHSLTCPTYVGNLVHGVHLASINEHAVGEAFIITDGLTINWKQFTETIADQLRIKYPKFSIPLNLALPLASIVERFYRIIKSEQPPIITKYRVLNGGTDYYFSIKKARKLLGYEPLTSFKESVKNTVQWYRENH